MTDDPFMDGARWAEAAYYEYLFGDVIGPMLREANGIEKWHNDSQQWIALQA